MPCCPLGCRLAPPCCQCISSYLAFDLHNTPLYDEYPISPAYSCSKCRRCPTGTPVSYPSGQTRQRRRRSVEQAFPIMACVWIRRYGVCCPVDKCYSQLLPYHLIIRQSLALFWSMLGVSSFYSPSPPDWLLVTSVCL